jgi:hypothetical protein
VDGAQNQREGLQSWRSPTIPESCLSRPSSRSRSGSAAIGVVREFIDTVDWARPLQGEGAFARQRVIDSMLEMADRLVDCSTPLYGA